MLKLADYHCPACDRLEEFELTEEGWTCDCTNPPTKMQRIYSLGATIFRGSGFYKTDSRSRSS